MQHNGILGIGGIDGSSPHSSISVVILGEGDLRRSDVLFSAAALRHTPPTFQTKITLI
jgi:hypothetical protein